MSFQRERERGGDRERERRLLAARHTVAALGPLRGHSLPRTTQGAGGRGGVPAMKRRMCPERKVARATAVEVRTSLKSQTGPERRSVSPWRVDGVASGIPFREWRGCQWDVIVLARRSSAQRERQNGASRRGWPMAEGKEVELLCVSPSGVTSLSDPDSDRWRQSQNANLLSPTC